MRTAYVTNHALASKHELCVPRPEEVFWASHGGIILLMLMPLKAYHHEQCLALVVSLLIKGTLKRLSLRAIYTVLCWTKEISVDYINVMASSAIIEMLFMSDGLILKEHIKIFHKDWDTEEMNMSFIYTSFICIWLNSTKCFMLSFLNSKRTHLVCCDSFGDKNAPKPKTRMTILPSQHSSSTSNLLFHLLNSAHVLLMGHTHFSLALSGLEKARSLCLGWVWNRQEPLLTLPPGGWGSILHNMLLAL